MGLSVVTPINQALDRTKRILFDPFDLKKWFVLGFCAWLSRLGEGGGGGNIRVPGGGGQPGGPGCGEFAHAKEWVLAHIVLIVTIAAAIFLLCMALWLLLLWLKSRGKFMFLDGVVHNRAAVRQPWREYKERANSLFWFLVILGVISLGVLLLILATCGVLVWSDVKAEHFGAGAIAAILFFIVAIIPFALLCILVDALTFDFVVPIMYIRGVRIVEAWAAAKNEIFSPHLGSVALFYLMKILLAIVTGIIALIVVCLACVVTCCCIVIVPYIGTVLLLPLFVFMRCYSLFFIEQVGPQLKIFPVPADTNDLLPRYPA